MISRTWYLVDEMLKSQLVDGIGTNTCSAHIHTYILTLGLAARSALSGKVNR